MSSDEEQNGQSGSSSSRIEMKADVIVDGRESQENGAESENKKEDDEIDVDVDYENKSRMSNYSLTGGRESVSRSEHRVSQ